MYLSRIYRTAEVEKHQHPDLKTFLSDYSDKCVQHSTCLGPSVNHNPGKGKGNISEPIPPPIKVDPIKTDIRTSKGDHSILTCFVNDVTDCSLVRTLIV